MSWPFLPTVLSGEQWPEPYSGRRLILGVGEGDTLLTSSPSLPPPPNSTFRAEAVQETGEARGSICGGSGYFLLEELRPRSHSAGSWGHRLYGKGTLACCSELIFLAHCLAVTTQVS